MLYIDNTITDPRYNLGLEEYLFTTLPETETALMLWQNRNAVIIGKYQNAFEEVNLDYAREHEVAIVRRITGGGAVYHDLGNLNFTFISTFSDTRRMELNEFVRPVARALNRLGVPAVFSGRNDILVDGKKISGTAQYRRKTRALFHGTLLFDVDLDLFDKVLLPSAEKMRSKGVKSVRGRVTNVRPWMNRECGIDEFKRGILACIADEGELISRAPSIEEDEAARALAQSKYNNWDWNFGKSPPADFRNDARFACGEISVRLRLAEGQVEECRIYGDFLGLGELAGLEEKLRGLPYEFDAVNKAVADVDFAFLFGGLSKDEFLRCFFGWTR